MPQDRLYSCPDRATTTRRPNDRQAAAIDTATPEPTDAPEGRDRPIDTPDDGVVVVDAVGKACPLPVIDLAAAVGASPVGTSFRLLADDPAAKVDVPVWCRMQRQRLDDVTHHDQHVAFHVTKVREGS